MRYFFATIVAFMALIASFNAWVNVAGLGSERVYALAKQQTLHQKLASDGQFDQRAWVKGRLEQGCPTTLILGSSTSGRIEASGVGHAEVLNAWLTGPMVEDFQGIAQILVGIQCTPTRVLLGLDAFLVDPKQTSDRWRILWAEQRAFVGARSWDGFHVARGGWRRFKDLLSYQTTRDGLGLVFSGAQVPAPGPQLVDDVAEFCAQPNRRPRIRHRDGHFSTCPGTANTVARAAEIARTYVQRDMHGVRSWRSNDEERLSALFGVIGWLQERGSTVSVFTPPYHPLTYAALRSDPGISARLDALDEALESMSRQKGVVFHRLRDPALIGCGPEDFTDSHHSTGECSARLVRAVITPAP